MILFIRTLARLILRLRYRIRVSGLDNVKRRGRQGILFLPNHPALIDPPIIMTELHRDFSPHALADRDVIGQFMPSWVRMKLGIHTLTDPAKAGDAGRLEVEQILRESVAILQGGKNLLLYPAGRIYRSRFEDLGANSAVESILKEMPAVRIVLIRTRGLWGSSFSRSTGKAPDMVWSFLQGFLILMANGIFFSPRREVTVELAEPEDLPRGEGRDALNRYMEQYYNEDVRPNTFVPHFFWEKSTPRRMPEPAERRQEGDINSIPAGTRELVLAHLRELTGRNQLEFQEKLGRDLGLDSLARVELSFWVESEFGFPIGEEALETVEDVMFAANGNVAAPGSANLKPIPRAWFRDDAAAGDLDLPAGESIPAVFLQQARRHPGQIVLADQTGGPKSYRDIVTAILVLKPEIEKLEGEYMGIMLPASAGAAVIYLATLFAGKIPVMVNWTAGMRSMLHSLDLLGVRHILTAAPLVQKIESQGGSMKDLRERFVMVEAMGREISRVRKLRAALMSRLSWQSLAKATVPETAVVLFTSGSESLPKAVPLTHVNILTNIRDFMKAFSCKSPDRLLGMLPPFHSFGITVTICFPLCAGLKTVYYPNPTEGGMLARLIAAYKVTVLVSTPTFLNGILRGATDEQLESLRAVVTGAEKCPARLYEAVARRLPQLALLEGYGITECSPAISVNDEKQPRPQTIGKVLSSVQYVIVDVEKGTEVAPGQVGLLLVRGPSIFSGYLNYDGPSPFMDFQDRRWYRTGDLVSQDEEGVLTFAGRLKRFVKIGGEMISLPAIEEVLLGVYGGPDDEGPVLAVEGTPTEDNPELILFTVKDLDRVSVNEKLRKAGLSALHNIRRIVTLDAIPTLGTGKTDYRKLQEILSSGQSHVLNDCTDR